MRRRIALCLVGLVVAAALAGSGAVQAAPSTKRKTLTGSVGPGFTIGVSKRNVTKGLFRITIHDRSGIHNFHLVGPGIDRRTLVSKTVTVTWNVRLKPGVYRFYCDPHPTAQNGRLVVR